MNASSGLFSYSCLIRRGFRRPLVELGFGDGILHPGLVGEGFGDDFFGGFEVGDGNGLDLALAGSPSDFTGL